MNVALKDYANIEPRTDTLFFKVGAHGLISFHGPNYNIKKRWSAEQRTALMEDPSFFRVSSDCYVNLRKIAGLSDDCLYFDDASGGSKRLPISKRKQQIVKQWMERHSGEASLV
ncbi:LytTR family transcriptional regulator DNA-binding domain-containing protein [Cohnella zeiphila]|uniref:LytTR family transcriptional regulator DNA-binding domain-containing protein n=1 Tax=Cohnella zeiphila TaxID=2761120 RepID=A0A7X0SKP0_9BACL|nr:LytTR family transcriptional regulator DNA-binding domain-containing protein [Cohnella zeiphila]MBB6731659.1 LytTR family transcriptional regulator DNA-binding domain-containing protein [Cohnella zeiphila]